MEAIYNNVYYRLYRISQSADATLLISAGRTVDNLRRILVSSRDKANNAYGPDRRSISVMSNYRCFESSDCTEIPRIAAA